MLCYKDGLKHQFPSHRPGKSIGLNGEQHSFHVHSQAKKAFASKSPLVMIHSMRLRRQGHTGSGQDSILNHLEAIMTSYECKTCGKVTMDKGHLCAPTEIGKIYACEQCGKQVSNEEHVCKPMLAEFKYFCNDCGRGAVSDRDVCNPLPIE